MMLAQAARWIDHPAMSQVTTPVISQPPTRLTPFIRQFIALMRTRDPCADVDLRGSLRLGKGTLRLPPPDLPLQILLGGEQGYRLHLYPELVLDPHGRPEHRGDYLLLDPLSYFSDIAGFVRVTRGDSLTLGRENPMQRLLLRYPRTVDRRHLRLKLSTQGLALKNKSSRLGVCVAPLTDTLLQTRPWRWRHAQLARLTRALGGPIEPLPRAAALELIEETLAVMAREPYRALDRRGRPGGLLILPDRVRPIFVGDLRARIDNLLVLLTQNGFMQALDEGSAVLILLGNAIHPAPPEPVTEMTSSMLMMDLLCRLKLRFPERVFYLRGEQDSFSETILTAGIPQGLLWEQALHEARGARYRDAMRRLQEGLPYLAASSRYLAAPAGLPLDAPDLQALVDLTSHPTLIDQVLQGRARGTADDPRAAARLLRRLGLHQEAICVLGTGPRDPRAAPVTGPIHRLTSADPDWVATLTRPHRRLVPLSYPVEPLLPAYNRFVRTGRLDAERAD